MLYYPIGKQEFRVIRGEGFAYVDKTEWTYRLAVRSSQYLLSRPRRFGKSLLLSTLKELFSGERALFKGLWIEPHLDEIEKRPVIHISFSNIGHKAMGLINALVNEMKNVARQNGISLSEAGSYDVHFKEIIERLSADQKIAILIDEYDKPIIDYLDDIEQAEANRDILKSFFSVLKGAENNIHLLFITGVSKFSQVSIFSDLNHLEDLSLDHHFSTMTGFTQNEVESVFGERITEIGIAKNLSSEEIRQEVKRYYNGYSWDGQHYVYNPFSLLRFLKNGSFDNFWFETGTPTFLVKHIRASRLPDTIEGSKVLKGTFNKFDLKNLDVIAVMFQTGYLTVKKAEGDGMSTFFTLGYPNEEVRFSFEFYLLEVFAAMPGSSVSLQLYDLKASLFALDAPAFTRHLKAFFSSIPYEMAPPPGGSQTNLWEGHFHALTYLLLKVIGLDVQAEVASAKGKTDVVVTLEHAFWVIEFKLGTARSAINQIKRQGYADPYLTSGKPVMLLGIGFDSKIRNVKSSVWEKLEP